VETTRTRRNSLGRSSQERSDVEVHVKRHPTVPTTPMQRMGDSTDKIPLHNGTPILDCFVREKRVE